MVYVISKLANANTYTFYDKTAGGLPTIKKEITIDGKAGVMQKGLITLGYSVTKITEEEAELLKTHPVFKMHMNNGFVSFQADKESERVEKVVKEDMTSQKDAAAPLTPQDYDSGKKKGRKPKTKY